MPGVQAPLSMSFSDYCHSHKWQTVSQSSCTALTAGICPQFGLCRETVKPDRDCATVYISGSVAAGYQYSDAVKKDAWLKSFILQTLQCLTLFAFYDYKYIFVLTTISRHRYDTNHSPSMKTKTCQKLCSQYHPADDLATRRARASLIMISSTYIYPEPLSRNGRW